MNLPNKLTMFRIVLIPVFIIVLLLGHYYIAAAIFVGASLTDMLDGKIARKYNLVTNFGKLMDPLADKLLVMSALVCLVELGQVPGWMVIVILAREFAITGLRQVAAAEGVVIAAGWSGKIKTVIQMVTIVVVMIHNWPCCYINFPLDQILLYVTVAITIYSGIEYIVKNRKLLNMK